MRPHGDICVSLTAVFTSINSNVVAYDRVFLYFCPHFYKFKFLKYAFPFLRRSSVSVYMINSKPFIK